MYYSYLVSWSLALSSDSDASGIRNWKVDAGKKVSSDIGAHLNSGMVPSDHQYWYHTQYCYGSSLLLHHNASQREYYTTHDSEMSK